MSDRLILRLRHRLRAISAVARQKVLLVLRLRIPAGGAATTIGHDQA